MNLVKVINSLAQQMNCSNHQQFNRLLKIMRLIKQTVKIKRKKNSLFQENRPFFSPINWFDSTLCTFLSIHFTLLVHIYSNSHVTTWNVYTLSIKRDISILKIKKAELFFFFFFLERKKKKKREEKREKSFFAWLLFLSSKWILAFLFVILFFSSFTARNTH